eukprot:scaffold2319_cov248-Pinguiococcus_pyrenoidosus.AAC.12
MAQERQRTVRGLALSAMRTGQTLFRFSLRSLGRSPRNFGRDIQTTVSGEDKLSMLRAQNGSGCATILQQIRSAIQKLHRRSRAATFASFDAVYTGAEAAPHDTSRRRPFRS